MESFNGMKCFNCNEKSCSLSNKEEMFTPCPSCGDKLILKLLKNNKYAISCKNYKHCKSETVWLPEAKDISISKEYCKIHKNVKQLQFIFQQGQGKCQCCIHVISAILGSIKVGCLHLLSIRVDRIQINE
jgi:ssDNA-binding Zn-finger/Zn-ribbon topoisomerase 1